MRRKKFHFPRAKKFGLESRFGRIPSDIVNENEKFLPQHVAETRDFFHEYDTLFSLAVRCVFFVHKFFYIHTWLVKTKSTVTRDSSIHQVK